MFALCLLIEKKVMTYSDPIVTYDHLKMTYSYPNVNYSGLKVTLPKLLADVGPTQFRRDKKITVVLNVVVDVSIFVTIFI